MTKSQNTQLLAVLAQLLGVELPAQRKPAIKSKIVRFDTSKLSPAVVSDRTERQLNRYSSVARGFHRKGLKNTDFTLAPGGTDTVRTYKGWLANGRIVKKGQHGVKGLFHVSQTQEYVQPKAVDLPANVQIGQTV